MSKKLVKRYVVWEWRIPWVYSNWKSCEDQVRWFPNAKFKSFTTQSEAKKAFEVWLWYSWQTKVIDLISSWSVTKKSISVDAACENNPGLLEWRWVITETWEELFRSNVYDQWTVNIGEYIVLMQWTKRLLDNGKNNRSIYSDSRVAQWRLKKRKHNSALIWNHNNAQLKYVLEQWELWYDQQNSLWISILKWNTKERGEIPADFWRK